MKINKKIVELGKCLEGRLSSDLIMFAVEYTEYSESALALETLCDCIAEYDIVLNGVEYLLVLEIAKELNLQLDARYLYIKPNE